MISGDTQNRVLIYNKYRHFCLGEQKSQITKIHIFAYGQIYNTLCNTHFHTEHQEHILFKLRNALKQTFSSRAKASQPQTSLRVSC